MRRRPGSARRFSPKRGPSLPWRCIRSRSRNGVGARVALGRPDSSSGPCRAAARPSSDAIPVTMPIHAAPGTPSPALATLVAVGLPKRRSFASSQRSRVRSARVPAGAPSRQDPRFPFKDLRHTFATRRRMQGRPHLHALVGALDGTEGTPSDTRSDTSAESPASAASQQRDSTKCPRRDFHTILP